MLKPTTMGLVELPLRWRLSCCRKTSSEGTSEKPPLPLATKTADGLRGHTSKHYLYIYIYIHIHMFLLLIWSYEIILTTQLTVKRVNPGQLPWWCWADGYFRVVGIFSRLVKIHLKTGWMTHNSSYDYHMTEMVGGVSWANEQLSSWQQASQDAIASFSKNDRG